MRCKHGPLASKVVPLVQQCAMPFFRSSDRGQLQMMEQEFLAFEDRRSKLRTSSHIGIARDQLWSLGRRYESGQTSNTRGYIRDFSALKGYSAGLFPRVGHSKDSLPGCSAFSGWGTPRILCRSARLCGNLWRWAFQGPEPGDSVKTTGDPGDEQG